MINTTKRATDNMDDYVDISTQEGFENDLTSEGFTLQLKFSETSFEITFTFVSFTIAFFECIGNLVTIGKIVHDLKYHTRHLLLSGC